MSAAKAAAAVAAHAAVEDAAVAAASAAAAAAVETAAIVAAGAVETAGTAAIAVVLAGSRRKAASCGYGFEPREQAPGRRRGVRRFVRHLRLSPRKAKRRR
jgi:hypothetical protein